LIAPKVELTDSVDQVFYDNWLSRRSLAGRAFVASHRATEPPSRRAADGVSTIRLQSLSRMQQTSRLRRHVSADAVAAIGGAALIETPNAGAIPVSELSPPGL